MGRRYYPLASQLLLCADNGGSNSSLAAPGSITSNNSRTNWTSAWEVIIILRGPASGTWWSIAFFAHQLELEKRTPGGYRAVVDLIGSTQTQNGLRVKAKPDKRQYGTGKNISDEGMHQLNIE